MAVIVLSTFVYAVVLWIAEILFPEYIWINLYGMVMAVLLTKLISSTIILGYILLSDKQLRLDGNWLLLISAFVAIWSNMIAFSLLSGRLYGFLIIGFIPRLILSTIFAAVTTTINWWLDERFF